MTDCYSNRAAVARVGDALDERVDDGQISWVIPRERDVLASPPISRHPCAQLPRAARSLDVRVARRAADLHVRPADDRQPFLKTAAAQALLAAIRQAQVT